MVSRGQEAQEGLEERASSVDFSGGERYREGERMMGQAEEREEEEKKEKGKMEGKQGANRKRTRTQGDI